MPRLKPRPSRLVQPNPASCESIRVPAEEEESSRESRKYPGGSWRIPGLFTLSGRRLGRGAQTLDTSTQSIATSQRIGVNRCFGGSSHFGQNSQPRCELS